jgi:predicted enzyme related to lactoylglutathione lyase
MGQILSGDKVQTQQKKGSTQWSPFAETTKYFEPSTKDFMINYRVENLEVLVEQLKKEGVTIVDKIEAFEYGKFVHIIDVEGNKVELWEPNDIE